MQIQALTHIQTRTSVSFTLFDTHFWFNVVSRSLLLNHKRPKTMAGFVCEKNLIFVCHLTISSTHSVSLLHQIHINLIYLIFIFRAYHKIIIIIMFFPVPAFSVQLVRSIASSNIQLLVYIWHIFINRSNVPHLLQPMPIWNQKILAVREYIHMNVMFIWIQRYFSSGFFRFFLNNFVYNV